MPPAGFPAPGVLILSAAIMDILSDREKEPGDPVTGRGLLAALLPFFERVAGPEHPDTLATRNSLAYWTGQAQSAN